MDVEEGLLQQHLEVFAKTFQKGDCWASIQYGRFVAAGFTSISKLKHVIATKEFRDKLQKTVPNHKERPSIETIKALDRFLPSQVGLDCLQLGIQTAEHVKVNPESTSYEHRSTKSRDKSDRGNEVWDVTSDTWTLKTDCAGFIRNIYETIEKRELHEALQDEFGENFLSDRHYLRAKDFRNFFRSMSSVTDTSAPKQSWVQIPEVTQVIPGDILAYSTYGGAAGGSEFTKTKLLNEVIRKVAFAYIPGMDRYDKREYWMKSVISKLKSIGIEQRSRHDEEALEELKRLLPLNDEESDVGDAKKKRGAGERDGDGAQPLNIALELHGWAQNDFFDKEVLGLLRAATWTKCSNTGHVVMATGFPEERKDGFWRIAVVHCSSRTADISVGDKVKKKLYGGVHAFWQQFKKDEDGWKNKVWDQYIAIGRQV